MSQEFPQDFCKIILQFLGKVPLQMIFFLEFFKKLFYFSHLWTLFKGFSRTVSTFLVNFIKFLRRFFAVSLEAVQSFFRIKSKLSWNFSKPPTVKSSWNLRKFFQYNFYKIISKYTKNFHKIPGKLFPNFLRKHWKMQD